MADVDRSRTVGPRPGHSIGVALIDAIPLFRDGFQALLAGTPGLRLLGSTQNVHAATVLCERFRPDVVLVDAVLDPRGHLVRLLGSASPAPAVLSVVREPYRTAQFVAEVLALGAHGVLPRSAEAAQYVKAIRRVHAERRYVDPSLSMLAGREPAAKLVTTRQPLSRREHQVLALIADGMENQAIGKALFVSVETVRTHVKSILRKLHARDRAHAVAVAFRTGALTAQTRAAPDVEPQRRTSSSES